MHNPLSLYDLSLKAAFKFCVGRCKCHKHEFRALPDNVLFDFYYTAYLEKRPCFLASELSNIEIFLRIINIKHKRVNLLKIFQSLINHGTNIPDDIVVNFSQLVAKDVSKAIEVGIQVGDFFNQGGWYEHCIKILNIVEELCQSFDDSQWALTKCLECYHKRIYAETIYCEFKSADQTFNSAQNIIQKLNSVPNLAGLYGNFSLLFFHKSEYDEAFFWSKKSLMLLNEKLPVRIKIEVLRQASRACVVKRRFNQAGLLINQAVNLAQKLHQIDDHPHFSDTLLDFGFYLLNYDLIRESVKVYEKALVIRMKIFEKNNIQLALAHEDLAYALYVNEYSSGRFYSARDNADRAMRLMERILPSDHLMLASAKRVKALILEEMALDMHEISNAHVQEKFLSEAEQLHRAALTLSRKAFGEKNVQTAKHYGNLGRLYQSMKQFEHAESMHLKAIAIKEELLGGTDYEVGLSIGHLASLYNYHMKKYHEAEKLYIRSMEINLSLFGETYSGFEYDYRGLINVYSKLSNEANVVLYTLKMREWSNLRARAKPPTLEQQILPLESLIEKFHILEHTDS